MKKKKNLHYGEVKENDTALNYKEGYWFAWPQQGDGNVGQDPPNTPVGQNAKTDVRLAIIYIIFSLKFESRYNQ